jgi:hypothetical protein
MTEAENAVTVHYLCDGVRIAATAQVIRLAGTATVRIARCRLCRRPHVFDIPTGDRPVGEPERRD